MKGIIYKATSKTTGKSYIGETIKLLEERIEAHAKQARNSKQIYKFQNAINKYGIDDFEWQILEEYSAPTQLLVKRILLNRETELIIEHDTYHNGYNSSQNAKFENGIYFFDEININLKEYLNFCREGNSLEQQAKHYNLSRGQIKYFRKNLCYEYPELRQKLNEYNEISFRKGMLTRNTYINPSGKDNPNYKEIIINEDEYIKKAKEGLNRIELANYFNLPENHIKVWRKRKIQEDEKYKKLFNDLDKIRRFGTSANNKKLINRLPKDIIDNVKQLSEQNFSMNKIAEKLNLSFPQVRAIKRGLGIGK